MALPFVVLKPAVAENMGLLTLHKSCSFEQATHFRILDQDIAHVAGTDTMTPHRFRQTA